MHQHRTKHHRIRCTAGWAATRQRNQTLAMALRCAALSPPQINSFRTRSPGHRRTRCTSNGLSVRWRMDRTTTGPMVMFGTKRPSMTSMWIQSAPARSMATTCGARRSVHVMAKALHTARKHAQAP